MPFGMTMTTLWVVIMVLFLVVEAATVGLVCIWFAVGALIARINLAVPKSPLMGTDVPNSPENLHPTLERARPDAK